MSKRWFCGACLALFSLGPVETPAAEPTRRAGVLWEETVEMSPMGGFRMPPQTREVCRPARPEDWSGPPSDPKQDDCKVTSMQRSGSKMSWKVSCEKQRITGDGEMAWVGDSSYSGTVNMHSAEHGDFSTKIRGKKLGGACDADREQKRAEQIKQQVAESQVRSAQVMKGMCDGAVENFDFNLLESEHCKGRVKDACARMETIAGYRHLAPLPEVYRGRAERACGKQLESLVPQLCAQAARNLRPGDAQTNENLSFITEKCPSEKQALAQRECAGRSYTGQNGPAEWMRHFCYTYAQDQLERRERTTRPARVTEPDASSPQVQKKMKRAEPGDAKDEAPEKAKDDAVEKAKKAAKGIFGF